MRPLLLALATLQLLNGGLMLAAPQFWYGAVPGEFERVTTIRVTPLSAPADNARASGRLLPLRE